MRRNRRQAAGWHELPVADDRQAKISDLLATALRHHPAGRLAEAEDLYRRILALDPRNPDGLLLLGTVACQTGRRDLALELTGQAIPVAPDTARYQANLGKMLLSLGRTEQALACLRRSAMLDPDAAETQKSLGAALHRAGDTGGAEACYRRALSLEPQFPAALNGLGNIYLERGSYDEATDCYRQALAVDPDYPDALGNLGNALFQQDRLEEAAECLQRAITLSPGLELGHFYLAEVRCKQERLDEAVACYRTALALNPDREVAHHNLGAMHQRLADPQAAAACFRAAIRLRPDFPEAHNNLGMSLLALGDMPAGWQELEWRWQVSPNAEAKRDFSQPQWRGEPAAGKTVLIHAEQGYGDTLQFCRYAPLVRVLGLRVILEAPLPLVRLLGGLQGVESVVPTGGSLPPFDLHCPMLSLPLAFGTTVDTIPGETPYLFADSAEVAAWSARLAPTAGAGPRIGLVWAGSSHTQWPAAAEIDRRRSVPPERFGPLLAVPGLQFYSLQIGGPPAPAGFPLIDHMDEMHDFADTAALVANLDLVVSVDTAVAHLAGALGRPVCLLDRFDHCWRWLAGRRDTPWYGATRLYRQPRPGDWASVVAELAADLRVLSEGWHAAFQESETA
ncbi:MAG TPA: tetratricopeptide repeat-containing glycosyltransferase family protein [Acetobacteraceae bacterium]|nr:tetratricopeptide repeat-containing glycosyltransferase family protein [Acetobacteraceae bacterium]